MINYQGRIVAAGVNFDGPGQFKFALVNEGATQAYWMNAPDLSPSDGVPDSGVTLPVTKGLYSVALGNTALPGMSAIPASVFANPAVFLRVWFHDGTHGWERLAPDQRLAAVAYAMMAESVPDGSITASKLAEASVTAGKIAPGSVGTAQLATGAVTADRIAAGAVTPASIGAETPAGAQSKVEALAGSFAAGGMSSLKAMLEEGRRDACIHIISDSTNTDGLWSNLLLDLIKPLYPKYTIKTTHWVPPGPDWSAPTVVQSGNGNGGGERRWEFPAGTAWSPIGYGPDFPMPLGNLDIRVRARIDNSSATANYFLSKWGAAPSRGFYLAQDSTANGRRLLLGYSTDGAATVSVQSTDGIGINGINDGTPYWARVTIDIDNGEGGKTITFYTSMDGSAWTQLGLPVTTTEGGTQPLAGGTTSCYLGGVSGPATFRGAIYAAEIRSSIGGPVIHPRNLNAWSFNQGSVFLAGAPELWVSNAAYSAASVDTFLSTPVAHYCQNYSPQIILISLSHNNPRESGNVFINKMKTLVANLRATYGEIPRIIFLTQNPTVRVSAPIDPNSQFVDARMAHRAQFMSWASGAGYGVIDTWAAFENDPRPLEVLVGTEEWAYSPITSMTGNGSSVTVQVSDMSRLSAPGILRLAIIGARRPDGSPSPYNGAYEMTGRSGVSITGPGWVTFPSNLTEPVVLTGASVTPCDATHPSFEGRKLWANAIFEAFKRGIP